MTYDSPLSVFEGEVIPEVASLKEEGLVTPKEWDWEKGKYMLVHVGNWTPVTWVKCKNADYHPDIVIKQSRL